MAIDYLEKSEILKALGHPVRLKIVTGLLNHECNVNKIVRVLKLPQSTISQHLAMLRHRGIVQIRKDGVRTCYKVADARIKNILEALK